MEKAMRFWTSFLAAILFSSQAHAHLLVTYPSGGGKLRAGSPLTIMWVSEDHDCVYNVYFSPDSGAQWQTIAIGLPSATRTQEWTLPGQTTAKAVVRVLQDNTEGSDLEAKSKVFTIASGTGLGFRIPGPGSAHLDFQSGRVEIAFDLEKAGRISLQAFDAQGRLAATLLEGHRSRGSHRHSVFSNRLQSGSVYIFKLSLGNRVVVFRRDGSP